MLQTYLLLHIVTDVLLQTEQLTCKQLGKVAAIRADSCGSSTYASWAKAPTTSLSFKVKQRCRAMATGVLGLPMRADMVSLWHIESQFCSARAIAETQLQMEQSTVAD